MKQTLELDGWSWEAACCQVEIMKNELLPHQIFFGVRRQTEHQIPIALRLAIVRLRLAIEFQLFDCARLHSIGLIIEPV